MIRSEGDAVMVGVNCFFFFQAEDGIRDATVTGVQTCALPILIRHNFDRMFRPPQLCRIIEPISGLPRITIRFRPTHDYGDPITQFSIGSNHIRYWGGNTVIRLTTDAPLSFVEREAPFVLTRPVHMVFGTDEPFPGGLASTCREFFNRTRDYWREWIRRLAIAYDWQDAVIRAAITLKLSNFEETGGIVAALTTS